ncbi:hypothetical protein N7509_014205 [Penicillium cosmopolitanum]|uniref:Amino acid transporter transmembrane domain-containing protein n=1 Tax=Penicillium cosmopolitanum TaxID=1131564 RepID=A0A9W9V5E8_9EURO|nr:uncharacterized protein N7509_014205 [Penicillium cosmopolitanum]KAJ5369593.1 hypothetical protein N7509_014205 [Penicillium cosmopolitanum]
MTSIVQWVYNTPRQLEANEIDSVDVKPTDFPAEQDPFGDEREETVKYKTMTWWQTGMIMIAETISLGILSLPKALSILGLLPGIFTILLVGMISTYTGYTIGKLKTQHPGIHSMADAGDLLFGKAGRHVLGFGQLVFFIFVMGSHILTFSIMMNVLSDHSACTILYSSTGLLISFILTLPRRLERLSHLSTVSFISIIGAVLTSMIGVSASKMAISPVPLFAPVPTVHDACLAIANIIFAYAGHVAFFTLFSELRDIKDFPKALSLLQMCEMVMYTISAIVIYLYVGASVTSPALNSGGILFRKISYGIAIPTIVIGGVVNAHVAVKFIYVRLFRGTNSMHTRSFAARAAWAGICAALWIVSWLIAEGIPVFNDVLGLASSLFASWFSFSLPGFFWLYLNRLNKDIAIAVPGWRQRASYWLNAFLVVLGIVFVSSSTDFKRWTVLTDLATNRIAPHLWTSFSFLKDAGAGAL